MARVAENMAESGDWRIHGSGLILYNSKMPAVPAIVAMVSLVFGISVIDTIRFLLPLIGATTVPTGGLLAYKITKSKPGALGAGIFFAFSGPFVYLTSAAMKQVVGMALMVPAFLFFLTREKLTSSACLFLIMMSLVLVHHLTFLLLTSILGMALFYAVLIRYFESGRMELKKEIPAAAVLSLSATFAWWYYVHTSLEHMGYVSSSERILLFMVFFLWMILGSLVLFSKDVTKRSNLSGATTAFAGMMFIVALVLNHRTPIFGTLTTSTSLLILFVPYILFIMFCMIVGFEILRSTKNHAKPRLFGGIFGPVSLMNFAVVSGLDAISFGLFIRSYNYIDISIGIFAGISLAYVLQKTDKKKISKAVPALFLCAALMTLPLAYNQQDFSGIRDVTLDHEMDAMSIAAEIALERNLTIYTDQRYADILSPYYEVRADRSLPITIRNGYELPPGLILVSYTWTEVGAQNYPFRNIHISQDLLDNIIDSSDIVFSLGPAGGEIYLLYVPA